MKRKRVRLDDIIRVFPVLWEQSNERRDRDGGGGEQWIAHQVQRKNESLQVLFLQRMEDALLQIVQEEVTLGREPTTNGHDLKIRDATAVGGGLRAG